MRVREGESLFKALSRDVVSGLFFTVTGGGFILLSQNYAFGAGTRMGPGMFPTLVGSLLALLGIVIAVRGLREDAQAPDPIQARPFVLVLLSIATFALAVEPLGLFLAILLAVTIAACADRQLSRLAASVTAVVLAVGSCIIFVTLLGLPLSLWPSILR